MTNDMRKLMEAAEKFLEDALNEEIDGFEVTNKGRPLRREFSGTMFLPSKDVRVINLETKQELLVPWDHVEQTLGKKANRVMTEVMMNGFYEAGKFRIEIWEPRMDDVNEGYEELPPIDRERYTDLSAEGLEGPFMLRSGKVVYYDPKKGRYYDRDSDMYMTYAEYELHNRNRTHAEDN
jgi:hypothetical protein